MFAARILIAARVRADETIPPGFDRFVKFTFLLLPVKGDPVSAALICFNCFLIQYHLIYFHLI